MPEQAFTEVDFLRIAEMSEAETRGFRLACQTLMLWATQIEDNAKGLSNSGRTVPLDQMMTHSAKMTRGLAEALEAQSYQRPMPDEH